MNHSEYEKRKLNSLISWLRNYASTEIDSHLADKQGLYPPHIFMDFAEKGLFGIHISQEYGGLEFNFTNMLAVIEQLGAIDLTLATIVIENIQGAHTIENYASLSMKKQYLSKLAKGGLLTAGAMTEASAGSNPRAMKSIAIPHGNNQWLVRGSKRWVGMANSAELIAAYVQQFDKDNNWMGMSGFLIPRGTKGLRIGPATNTMGLRGFSKHTVYFDDIQVSTEHLLGHFGQGMEIAQDNMMHIRLCLAAASLGAMKRCVQLMHRYAERRSIVTGLLIENPVTLVQLSEMTAIIDALNHFIYTVAYFYDQNDRVIPQELFVASKILSTEYLGFITDRLVQLLGARGYEEKSGISKIFRDARVFRIFEGPTEALNMYLGSRVSEKNLELEQFISKILKQDKLFDDLSSVIKQIHKNCNQNYSLFTNSFSKEYWYQALVGELLSYGLLLAVTDYGFSKSHSQKLHRASLWIRNKFNKIINNSLKLSLGERVLIDLQQLRETISDYHVSIGDIEQTQVLQDEGIDAYLKKQEEHEIKQDEKFFETKSFSPNLPFELSPILKWNFNNISKEVLPNRYVHHLFEEQVNLTPEAIALIYEDKKISYQELNRRANQVAHHLINAGLSANEIVALYMERSIEMIVGLLAILKAGAAYLPLDFSYPFKTLEFMFENSGSEVILSTKKLASNLSINAKKIIFIEEIVNSSEANPIIKIDLNNLCYLIYTSGSTGKPKGVQLPHKALSNLIHWHQKKIPEKRNVLQFTALSFDMSFIEVFSALASGGRLILISELNRKDPWEFSKLVNKHSIEQLVLPVSFLKTLTSARLNYNDFKHLKEIIVAGEQITLSPSILKFFNQLSACRLLNYYGPSETHVVTAYTFPEKTADWPEYPPIGRPIYNTRIVLLDKENQPVPTGEIGEIHIGGPSLALGYINQPQLTQEKFIILDLGDEKETRLYKTGDLGKYLSNGQLLFIGRKDEQLKIRGFRIEPKEIEAQVNKFPGIKETCVIAKKGGAAEKHLEAFIVIEEQEDKKIVNLIYSHLQDRIPPHMIPSVFNVIDKMPLTNSGKIDRKKLEKYNNPDYCSINRLQEPHTQTEIELIEIIENIFNFPIGINQSFASIGGNSLLTMHVVALVRERFAIELPANIILSVPKISDIAKHIDSLICEQNKV